MIKITKEKSNEINKLNKFSYLLNQLIKISGDNLTSVVIFGSYARKNHGENSDVDLIVVTDKNIKFDSQTLRKEFLIKYHKKLDLYIISKEDAVNNFKNFSPLFSTLLLGKIVLFDKNMFFSNLFKEFVKSMINCNIKYCEGGKIWELSQIAKNLEALQ